MSGKAKKRERPGRAAATWFHGGAPWLNPGDEITPAPPLVMDGCPVCVARSEGRVYTVGEYRKWLASQGPEAARVLKALEGADDAEPVDPPSRPGRVYMTHTELYATWYAARSRGDLYVVHPVGPTEPSAEDHFDSASAERAVVVRVVQRSVRLVRSERRALLRMWQKADSKPKAGCVGRARGWGTGSIDAEGRRLLRSQKPLRHDCGLTLGQWLQAAQIGIWDGYAGESGCPWVEP